MVDKIKFTSQNIDNLVFDENLGAKGVVVIGTDGVAKNPATEETLQAVAEFNIPRFDTQIIDESAAPATTTITYKLAGATIATKTISVSGAVTTITVL